MPVKARIRSSRARFMLLFLVLPLFAQDANSIIERAVAHQKQNDDRAKQYTYTEEMQRFVIGKDGRERLVGGQTHDVIFVEGLSYKKLVLRDGKALSAKEQSKVDKDMQVTAEERRKHQHPPAPGGTVVMRGLFSHASADLGSLSELLTLFDNRLAGEEVVRGRKAWVIESTHKTGRAAASQHEREVLVFRKKLWVDEAEGALLRIVHTVVEEGSFMTPGSTMTFDFDKIDGAVWEPVSVVLEFSNAKQKEYKPTGRTVYKMSKFQKFDVQSTITVMEEK